MIETGDMDARSVRWLSVDISKVSLEGAPTSTNQVVYPKHGNYERKISFIPKREDSMEANMALLAMIVRSLTGDFIHEVNCNEIQEPGRYFANEVVFFGQKGSFVDP